MSLKEFVKIAVGLREHPKVLKAGDDGGWLYVCAIMWSKEHDTDGFIPEHVVPRLTGLKNPVRIAQRCAEAGLFDLVDGGWDIHDYLDVQESSEKRRAAGRKAANVRWDRERAKQSQSESHADSNAIAVRQRNTEEEKEKEKNPPTPPQAGGARDASRAERARNGSNRRRDRDALKATQPDWTAWAVEHLPDLPAEFVWSAVTRIAGGGHHVTPEGVRRAVLAAHPELAQEAA